VLDGGHIPPRVLPAEVGKGQHVYTFLARATRSGEFIALPAEAYAMYDERVWGRSPSKSLVIEAK